MKAPRGGGIWAQMSYKDLTNYNEPVITKLSSDIAVIEWTPKNGPQEYLTVTFEN